MKNLIKYIRIALCSLACLFAAEAWSQTTPTDTLPGDPGSLSIYTIQNMHFGAFTQGAIGGTILVTPTGNRTATGDVVLLNMGISFMEAIFELEGIVGSNVSILNGPNATLTGSNGGSMSMTIGTSTPASPFTIIAQPPSRTEIRVGGTLNVGAPASNPPGTYTGTFYITFNQE